MLKLNLPIIKQTEKAECGLACLAMVLCYWGHNITLVELRKKYSISTNGLNFEQISKISLDLKMASRPIKVSLSKIKYLSLPCILHWNMNHFVVLKKMVKKGVVIHDPALGERFISLGELNTSFTGVALELTPNTEFKAKIAKPAFPIKNLWLNSSGLKSSFFKVLTLSFLLQLFMIFSPYYLQTIIDKILPSRDHNFLFILAIAFSILILFQSVIAYMRGYIVLYLGGRFSIQVFFNLYQHLISLPLSFFEKRDVGDIVGRFESLDKIKEFLTNSFIETIVDGFMAFTVLAILFYYNVYLTFAVILFVIIYTVFRFFAFHKFWRINEDEIITKASEQSNFIETIQNMRTIMTFDGQSHRAALWGNLFTEYINQNSLIKKEKLKYQVVNSMIFGFENLFIIYFLASSILNNQMTIGMLTAYIAYKILFTQSYSRLFDKIMELKILKLHLERVADIVLTEKTHDTPFNESKPFIGVIEMKDVCFEYDSYSTEILTNITLDINPGDHFAIVGSSGCGKTTFIKILLGLLESTKGSILIDGMKLKDFGYKNYRKNVGAVMQDDNLYSGTILDNISFFEESPDIEFVIECAKNAQIHQMISKKSMAYHSYVGHQGCTLSGGEKQRIFIARALYRKPKILILDEASSHLDMKLEKKINDSISSMKITRIVIAHRPQTIANAEKIYRISKNGLIEIRSDQILPQKNLQSTLSEKASDKSSYFYTNTKREI